MEDALSEDDDTKQWNNTTPVSIFDTTSTTSPMFSASSLSGNRSEVVVYRPDVSSVRHAVLILYMTGFFFGVAGNSLVIAIIAYYRKVRIKSVANYYIWNLSLADLLFILTLPFFSYTTFTEDWPFGEVMCKISYSFRETNRFSSVFILVALSWDRFMASFYNLSHFRTIKLGVIICVIIWIICALMSTPYWLYAHTQLTRSNQTRCIFHWPSQYRMKYLTMWTYSQLVIGLLLPLLLIILAYVLLSVRLKQMLRGSSAIASSSSSSNSNSAPVASAGRSGVKKSSRKMTKTVLVVVVSFLLCQTPYYLMEVWALLQQQRGHQHRQRGERFIPTPIEIDCFIYLNALAQMLVFISSCINPILYGLMNDNYSK